MKKLSIVSVVAAVLALGALAVPAVASPITFDLQWSGSYYGNSASASGTITIDDSLYTQPASWVSGGIAPWVTALNVTVTGATAGNGTFTLSDFVGMNWDTNGGVLDLSTQLLGQPTNELPWGTPYSYNSMAGDFNLFNSSSSPKAPDGKWWFVLAANGGNDEWMQLTYFGIPGSLDPVFPSPEPSSIALLLGAMAGFAGLGMARRRKS